MINKQQVESFLKANGVPPSAKDEEIRSMLLSARWDNNEVDTALMVLKENTLSKETHVDTLHKIFQSDDRLTPVEISSLLGIDVEFTSDDVNDILKKRADIEKYRMSFAIFLSVGLTLLMLVLLMYINDVGPFYK